MQYKLCIPYFLPYDPRLPEQQLSPCMEEVRDRLVAPRVPHACVRNVFWSSHQPKIQLRTFSNENKRSQTFSSRDTFFVFAGWETTGCFRGRPGPRFGALFKAEASSTCFFAARAFAEGWRVREVIQDSGEDRRRWKKGGTKNFRSKESGRRCSRGYDGGIPRAPLPYIATCHSHPLRPSLIPPTLIDSRRYTVCLLRVCRSRGISQTPEASTKEAAI